MNRPILIFDADCSFCRRWIAYWQQLTAERMAYEPSQTAAKRYPQIDPNIFQNFVVFVEPDGSVSVGAEAVFRTLTYASGWRKWLFAAYRRVPGWAPLSEWFYALVARHRNFFSFLTRLFWGRSVEPSTYQLTRWIFLRALGLIYFIAFVSLGVQIIGLVGKQGILPAADYLQAAGQQVGGWERFWKLPTLFWFNASDGALVFVCVVGAILSLLLVVNLWPGPILLGLWALYLSLSSVTGVFLGFQWDILLLETGFLAIFWASWRMWPPFGPGRPPSRGFLWLLRWLLFRLMFASGLVKLTSGDSTWRDFTALNFHYETQPIPTWTSWYIHQMPEWFQKASVGAMFFIELVIPFLIFAPRRIRAAAVVPLVLFQMLIIGTGNYCFFNLITLALCLLLLDDSILSRFFPKDWRKMSAPSIRPIKSHRVRRFLFATLAVFVVVVSSVHIVGRSFRNLDLPDWAWKLSRWAAPFRSINGYGLFAVMTTSRPEIVVEGSQDGNSWSPYEFKWKPGDIKRRPGFVAPHQPRLDWQMWFAALGNYRQNPWLSKFLMRLLEGSPPVLSLLDHNPFPEKPPRYIRAMKYDYRFTDPATRRQEGTWWRRELMGYYTPVLFRDSSDGAFKWLMPPREK